MRLAVLVYEKPTPSETFINNHIRFLPFEVTVIYGGWIPFQCDEYVINKQMVRFLRFLDFVNRRSGDSYKKYYLKKWLRRKKIETVLAEYLNLASNVMDTCKELNVPLVTTALGYEISNYSVLQKYENGYRNLFKHCKKVVIVSNHMRENLRRFDCPEDKIIYSPAGPDETFFEVEPSYNTLNVLAIGRFVEKKAPYLTILAFQKVLRKVPKARLIMAGDGDYLPMCKDLVDSLKMSENVFFLGIINQAKQKELLADSSVFVQHSKVATSGDSEGTPVAILDAMAAGLPVVSTRHAGIPEVVEEEISGFLVKEGDIDDMADKIIILLKDKSLIKEMGRNGRANVKKNFSLNNHLGNLNKALTS
ncbi:MAG: glycosyltransferase family 4 protein [Cyclobacteriaceae bacterium]